MNWKFFYPNCYFCILRVHLEQRDFWSSIQFKWSNSYCSFLLTGYENPILWWPVASFSCWLSSEVVACIWHSYRFINFSIIITFLKWLVISCIRHLIPFFFHGFCCKRIVSTGQELSLVDTHGITNTQMRLMLYSNKNINITQTLLSDGKNLVIVILTCLSKFADWNWMSYRYNYMWSFHILSS